MDYTYVLCPNLVGILGLAILLVLQGLSNYLERKTLLLFRAAAIVNLVIILFEVADFMLGMNVTFPSAYLFRRFTSATGFALSPIFPLLLAHISSKARLPRWIYIPAVINILMSYASIFTGHMFLINQYNSYYRGPLFAIMLAISIFYMFFLIYMSFKSIKSMKPTESAFLICVAAVIVVDNLLEIIMSFHFLLWNSCALLLICYYLFLNIQYFKYDSLTNVLNRSVFTSELKNMKDARNIGVISFDLDSLKKINDADGHERGDAYIVACARLIDQCFSGIGHSYRIGGDEFVVLASGITEKVIRDKIQTFEKECQNNGVSVSCGYSFCVSAVDVDQMLRDADREMYENKRIRKINRKA